MMPRSPDLAIFVMTTDRQTDKSDCFTPCACARGNETLNLKQDTVCAVPASLIEKFTSYLSNYKNQMAVETTHK